MEFSGIAMWSVIHLHSTMIFGDFRASASGSGGSGVRATRRGSSTAIVQVTRHADARLARMPASRGCRLTPMLAMTGYSPRAEENTRHDRLCRERKSTATRPGGTAPNSNLRLKRMNFE